VPVNGITPWNHVAMLCQRVNKRTCCPDLSIKKHHEFLCFHVVLKKSVFLCHTQTQITLLSRIEKKLPADGNITAKALFVSASVVIASTAPTPITDSQLYCDFAGGCPLSSLCFLWSVLRKYLFLHHEVCLLLPSLKTEPLAFCSSDETSWAPSAASPRPLHQCD